MNLIETFPINISLINVSSLLVFSICPWVQVVMTLTVVGIQVFLVLTLSHFISSLVKLLYLLDDKSLCCWSNVEVRSQGLSILGWSWVSRILL